MYKMYWFHEYLNREKKNPHDFRANTVVKHFLLLLHWDVEIRNTKIVEGKKQFHLSPEGNIIEIKPERKGIVC